MIINSGIETVVFRTKDGTIRIANVEGWVKNDDSLIIHGGY